MISSFILRGGRGGGETGSSFVLSGETLGVSLALVSTLAFSGSSAVLSRPLLKSDPNTANFVGLIVGMVISGVLSLAFGRLASVLTLSWLLVVILALVGLFHFNISRLLTFRALKEIGANQTLPITATQIVYSVVLAVLFLNESLTLGIAAGSLMIGLGVIVLRVRDAAKMRGGRYRLGLEAALLAGLIYGITPIAIKYVESAFPYFISATFVAYVFAVLSYIPRIKIRSVFANLAGSSRGALFAYALSGVFLVTAQLARFDALQVAPVVLVAPILTLYPLFIPLFTWSLAKDVEAFQWRTMLGILLCAAGSILVSIG